MDDPRRTKPFGHRVRRASAARIAAVAVALFLLQPTAWSDAGGQEVRGERIDVPGLDQAVEILKDRWGIAHIYAETEHDLFFAQGYSAARDRLFQLELWRRQATGTVAEILGPRELRRDIGTRLFKFRGDLEQELSHYHPRGVAIINAFVEGINAYVDQALADPELLSVEFDLLGIRPGKWTPEVVILGDPLGLPACGEWSWHYPRNRSTSSAPGRVAVKVAVKSRGPRVFAVSGGLVASVDLAGAAGFEPTTGGFGDRCSTRLSYTPIRRHSGYCSPRERKNSIIFVNLPWTYEVRLMLLGCSRRQS